MCDGACVRPHPWGLNSGDGSEGQKNERKIPSDPLGLTRKEKIIEAGR